MISRNSLHELDAEFVGKDGGGRRNRGRVEIRELLIKAEISASRTKPLQLVLEEHLDGTGTESDAVCVQGRPTLVTLDQLQQGIITSFNDI
jgi:hypothetical protein